jgi:uncharacterized protein (TIGR02678 family)
VSHELIDDTLGDRRRAARLLLRDGWLERREHPELMEVVWRCRERLAADFADVLGYRLQVERDLARLRKRPLRTDPRGREPRMRSEAKSPPTRDLWPAFEYEHYLLCFLLLAELERDPNRPQALISTLAEGARQGALGVGTVIDYAQGAHRRALCEVLRWLEDRGVLELIDGDRLAFARADERATEALYTIDRLRLDRLAPTIGIAGLDLGALRAAAMAEPPPAGEEGRRLRSRQLVARRLAEDPFVYFDDLPAEEAHAFRQQRRPVAELLGALTGMPVEHRAEGSALLDHTVGEATDLRFPTQQRDRQAALLLCASLAERHADQPFTVAEAELAADALLRIHPGYWPQRPAEFAVAAIEQLVALDLLSRRDTTLRLRPAAGRFRDAAATVVAAPDPQEALL